MKYLTLLFLLLTGCTALPQLFQSVDDIATDDAIQVIVSREALNKDTDVDVQVNLKNNVDSSK